MAFNPWALPVQETPLSDAELMMQLQGMGASPARPPLPTGPTQPRVVTPPSPEKVVLASKAAKTLLGLPDAPARAPALKKSPSLDESDRGFQTLLHELQSKVGTTERSNQALDEGEYQTVKDRVNRMEVQALEDQNRGLDTSLSLAKQYSQIPAALDLSAIAGLIDYENQKKGLRTNLSSTYKAPNQAREIAAEGIKLNEGLQKQRGQFSKEQIDLLKANLQGYRTEQVLKDIQDKLTTGYRPAQTANPASASRAQDSFDREYRSALKPLHTEMNTAFEQFKMIDAALASRDYQSINMVIAQLARRISSEKGVLTDPDIARVMPKSLQGDIDKWMAFFNNMTPTTVVSPEYADSMKKMVALAKQKSLEKFKDQKKSLEGIFKPDRKWGATAEGATRATEKQIDSLTPPPAPKKKTLGEQFMELELANEKKKGK